MSPFEDNPPIPLLEADVQLLRICGFELTAYEWVQTIGEREFDSVLSIKHPEDDPDSEVLVPLLRSDTTAWQTIWNSLLATQLPKLREIWYQNANIDNGQ